MPFTAYHLGPGAAIKAIMPRHFSFSVFCLAQIVTDCETGYHLVRGEWPLHRWLHTYAGASVVAGLCVLIGRPFRRAAVRLWHLWRSAPFKRYLSVSDDTSFVSTVMGAFLGTYSHVFLDSLMHGDIEPFWPWSTANPLYHFINIFVLHALCLLLGIIGVWYSVSVSINSRSR